MKSFMFYNSYRVCIDNIRTLLGDEAAEKLALEIVHYGVTGERLNKLPLESECAMQGIIPFIDNSLLKKEETIKRKQAYKKQKSQEKEENNNSKNLN